MLIKSSYLAKKLKLQIDFIQLDSTLRLIMSYIFCLIKYYGYKKFSKYIGTKISLDSKLKTKTIAIPPKSEDVKLYTL